MDGNIKQLEKPDINGDTESCETKIKPIEPLLTFYIDLELQFPKKEQNIVQIKNIISKSHLIQKEKG